MSDWSDWAMAILLGILGLFLIGVFCMFIGAMYFQISCWNSGNPDSMACYMANGRNNRVHVEGIK